jgi:hypothetical protein
MVLDGHADRVPGPDLAREIMMHAIARDTLRGAREALSTPLPSSYSVARARGYCWQAISPESWCTDNESVLVDPAEINGRLSSFA